MDARPLRDNLAPMMKLRPLMLALATAATMAAGPVPPPPPPGTAVYYGLHFVDTSTEGAINGVRADETKRVQMTSDLIAEDLKARGFTLMTPPPEKIAGIANPVESNRRDTKIAAEMGADYAIVGQVQKTSNLILAINLYIRDAKTGKNLRAGTVDMRGNNDESFRRAARYLLKNIIFRKE